MWTTGTVSVTGLAKPEEVRSLFATDGLLPILGVQPMLGRVFSRADDAPGGAETVVLTAGYWRAKFGGDRAARRPDRHARRRPREIIGVLPDAFRFLDRDVSLIVPLRLDRSKVVLGQFSYAAHGAAEAGPDDRRGRRRCRPHDPHRAAEVPAVSRGDAWRCSRRRGITPQIQSLKDDLVGDVQQRAVGADGHHRHGPADRLRQRRQPAAGARRVAAAGAGGPCRAGRQHGPDRPRAADGEPDARPARRRRRARAGVRGRAAAGGLAPGNLPRLQEIAIDLPVLLFALAVSLARGPAVRPGAGAQAGGRAARDHAAGRRADRERQQGTRARPQRAGRGAGRAGARAAGRLRA